MCQLSWHSRNKTFYHDLCERVEEFGFKYFPRLFVNRLLLNGVVNCAHSLLGYFGKLTYFNNKYG